MKLTGTVKTGGNALVKVKAAKTIASADLVPTLQGVVAFEVIGSGKSGSVVSAERQRGPRF